MFLQPSSLAPLSVGVLEPRRGSPGSSLQLSYGDPVPRQFSFNRKQALRIPYASLQPSTRHKDTGTDLGILLSHSNRTVSPNTILKGNILVLTWKGNWYILNCQYYFLSSFLSKCPFQALPLAMGWQIGRDYSVEYRDWRISQMNDILDAV